MSKLTLELGRARGGSGRGAPFEAKINDDGEGEHEDSWFDLDAGWFRLTDLNPHNLLRGTRTARRRRLAGTEHARVSQGTLDPRCGRVRAAKHAPRGPCRVPECLNTLAEFLECNDDGATLDDLREAVTTLEETERIARRVLGGAHPQTTGIDEALKCTRAALRARETPSPGSV